MYGYTCGGGCSGLTYYDGESSIVKGDETHHNRFCFYSKAVGELILEDNRVHHNFMYGFDPHTGTHDILILNNTLHDHGAMERICSVGCYNITIDGIGVYKSADSGIMFSRNLNDLFVGITMFTMKINAFLYHNPVRTKYIKTMFQIGKLELMYFIMLPKMQSTITLLLIPE